MKPMSDNFKYKIPDDEVLSAPYALPDKKDITFKKKRVSIPVLAFNISDGKRISLKTGDVVTLENPLGNSVKGKVFLTDEVMPGVIKTAFGPGGQKASGIGFFSSVSDDTPNINDLTDPENISPYTGMPGFGDILVKVIKL
jgi:anaerobic selenocysteine-containing dehydrogenase